MSELQLQSRQMNHKYITKRGSRGRGGWGITSRKVGGFDSRWCHWNFSLIKSFQPNSGPGVDSASNRNECQEYFLGVKAAGP